MDWLDTYRKSHQNPVNHACHAIGIPLIVVALPLALWSWRWAVVLFIAGWIFQFVGHYFEGKPPSFLSDPRYLVVGPYWWLRKMLGKLPKEEPGKPHP